MKGMEANDYFNTFVMFNDTGNYYVLSGVWYTVSEHNENVVWLYFRNGYSFKVESFHAIIERQNLDKVVMLTPYSDDLEQKIVDQMLATKKSLNTDNVVMLTPHSDDLEPKIVDQMVATEKSPSIDKVVRLTPHSDDLELKIGDQMVATDKH